MYVKGTPESTAAPSTATATSVVPWAYCCGLLVWAWARSSMVAVGVPCAQIGDLRPCFDSLDLELASPFAFAKFARSVQFAFANTVAASTSAVAVAETVSEATQAQSTAGLLA